MKTAEHLHPAAQYHLGSLSCTEQNKGPQLLSYLQVLPSLVKLFTKGSQALGQGGSCALQGGLAPLHDAGLSNVLHLVDYINNHAVHLGQGVLAHLGQVLGPTQLFYLNNICNLLIGIKYYFIDRKPVHCIS